MKIISGHFYWSIIKIVIAFFFKYFLLNNYCTYMNPVLIENNNANLKAFSIINFEWLKFYYVCALFFFLNSFDKINFLGQNYNRYRAAKYRKYNSFEI